MPTVKYALISFYADDQFLVQQIASGIGLLWFSVLLYRIADISTKHSPLLNAGLILG
jgi:hypothetical protein